MSSEHSIQVLKSYCREDWTCAARTEVHILTYTEEENLGKIGKKVFWEKIEVIFSLGISNFEIYRDKYNKPIFIWLIKINMLPLTWANINLKLQDKPAVIIFPKISFYHYLQLTRHLCPLLGRRGEAFLATLSWLEILVCVCGNLVREMTV